MAKLKSSSTRPSTSRRSSNGPKNTSRPKSTTERNASGYQKRQERKDKSRQNDDLYEYTANKNRRAYIALDVDREEVTGQRPSKNEPDEDDEIDSDMEKLRQKISANMDGDLGVVDSEDDEDIDSDEAFEGESDEERFGNFKFAMKKTSKKSPKPSSSKHTPSLHAPIEIDLNEDEPMSPPENQEEDSEESSSEDSEDDSDAVSLSAMLDRPDDAGDNDEEDSDDDQDSGPDTGPDVNMLLQSDDESAHSQDDEAVDKLGRFIDDLTPVQKRKAFELEGDLDANRRKRRRALTELNEAGVENEFATRGSAAGKISLDDLLRPLTSSKGQATSLDKTARMLASTKVESLSAPLHTRAQERLDRQAAYEATKEEVEKWAPTMKRIKEAEHLSFPLQKSPVVKTSTSELTGKFKPSTELESAVDRLLKQAKLRESDIEKTEELEMAHLTVEEVAARRAELRHMRELMFRADAKAKRVAKIKSKTYRKIQKKAKEKNALSLQEMDALDPEAAAAERLKLETERAKERATMRHKNTGKWAKQMMSRGQDMDVDQRREFNAQLERGEQLRRKIQGLGSDGEAEDSDSDPDEEIGDIATHAFNEVNDVGGADDPFPSGTKKKSGLLDMKFMRDAADRDSQVADRMADDFKAELFGLTGGGDDDTEPIVEEPSDFMIVQGNQGRMVYRPAADQSKPVQVSRVINPQPSTESDTSSVTLKSSVDPNGDSPQLRPSDSMNAHVANPAENPWLTGASSGSKLSRRKNEVLLSKHSTAGAKSQAMMKKRLATSDEALARDADDAVVEISLEDPGTASLSTPTSKATNVKPSSVVDPALQDSDDDAEDVDTSKKRSVAFKQKDLIALAFAGDNVVEEFSVRKQREVEAAAPREIDTTLPGWGSWGGRGVKKTNSAPKPYLIKKIAGIAPAARADAGKAHVIISEKKDKKASKYLVRDLPHPYTSKAQFERSLEQPVGAEWNTRTAFQKGTLPKVVKKMGAIIDPIQRKI